MLENLKFMRGGARFDISSHATGVAIETEIEFTLHVGQILLQLLLQA
jgi:hypothetical protein